MYISKLALIIAGGLLNIGSVVECDDILNSIDKYLPKSLRNPHKYMQIANRLIGGSVTLEEVRKLYDSGEIKDLHNAFLLGVYAYFKR